MNVISFFSMVAGLQDFFSFMESLFKPRTRRVILCHAETDSSVQPVVTKASSMILSTSGLVGVTRNGAFCACILFGLWMSAGANLEFLKRLYA